MFVHVGILHLATNMWCLWNLGLLAEPLMGWFGLFSVYILTGAAGNLLSTLLQLGAAHARRIRRAVLRRRSRSFRRRLRHCGRADHPAQIQAPARSAFELKRLRKSVIYFAAINLVIGLSVNFGSGFTGVEIDNSAHIGGFLCGLLFAVPLVPRIGSPRTMFQTRMRLAVTAIVILLVLFGFYMAHIPPPQGLTF